MRTNHYSNGGYAALLSTFIIATLLTILVFAAATSAFFARFDTLDYEDHIQAEHLARSCVYAALYSLAKDRTYRPVVGGVAITFDPVNICRIEQISQSGSTIVVQTSAHARHTESRIEAHIEISSPDSVPVLTSWEEINSS